MEFESEFERKLFDERREKLKKIAELGQAAYPNRFLPRRTTAIRWPSARQVGHGDGRRA